MKIIFKKKLLNTFLVFLFIFWILMIPYAIILHIDRYNNIMYPVRKAMAKIDRANAVNDLEDMASYIEEALKYLKDKHGNPCWFYPDDYNNWDKIKTGFNTVIKNCRIAENNTKIGTDAYQEAIDTATTRLDELRKQTENTVNWDYWTIEFAWLCIFWLILFWIVIVILFIIDNKIQHLENKIKNEKQNKEDKERRAKEQFEYELRMNEFNNKETLSDTYICYTYKFENTQIFNDAISHPIEQITLVIREKHKYLPEFKLLYLKEIHAINKEEALKKYVETEEYKSQIFI